MKHFTVYRKSDGIFTGRVIGAVVMTDDKLRASLSEDEGTIDGHVDHLSKCVDLSTGKVVDYQPPAPSSDHEWDADIKRWNLTVSAAGKRDARHVARARIVELKAETLETLCEVALGHEGAINRLRDIYDQIVAQKLIVGNGT